MAVNWARYLLKTVPRDKLTGLDSRGISWLHASIYDAEYDIAELLLKNGFDPKLKSRRGETLMALAIRLRRAKFVALLKRYGG